MTYPEYVPLFHTIRGNDMDTISVSIHILKPVVVKTPFGEETRGEWRLDSYQNHETGKLYTPNEDKALTRKILAIINSDLNIDAEGMYYEAVRAAV